MNNTAMKKELWFSCVEYLHCKSAWERIGKKIFMNLSTNVNSVCYHLSNIDFKTFDRMHTQSDMYIFHHSYLIFMRLTLRFSMRLALSLALVVFSSQILFIFFCDIVGS